MTTSSCHHHSWSLAHAQCKTSQHQSPISWSCAALPELCSTTANRKSLLRRSRLRLEPHPRARQPRHPFIKEGHPRSAFHHYCSRLSLSLQVANFVMYGYPSSSILLPFYCPEVRNFVLRHSSDESIGKEIRTRRFQLLHECPDLRKREASKLRWTSTHFTLEIHAILL